MIGEWFLAACLYIILGSITMIFLVGTLALLGAFFSDLFDL